MLRDPSAFVHALLMCRAIRHGLECGLTARGLILTTITATGSLVAGAGGVMYIQRRLERWANG